MMGGFVMFWPNLGLNSHPQVHKLLRPPVWAKDSWQFFLQNFSWAKKSFPRSWYHIQFFFFLFFWPLLLYGVPIHNGTTLPLAAIVNLCTFWKTQGWTSMCLELSLHFYFISDPQRWSSCVWACWCLFLSSHSSSSLLLICSTGDINQSVNLATILTEDTDVVPNLLMSSLSFGLLKLTNNS